MNIKRKKENERDDLIFCLKQISEYLWEQSRNVSEDIPDDILKSYVEKLLSIIGEYDNINWFKII